MFGCYIGGICGIFLPLVDGDLDYFLADLLKNGSVLKTANGSFFSVFGLIDLAGDFDGDLETDLFGDLDLFYLCLWILYGLSMIPIFIPMDLTIPG